MKKRNVVLLGMLCMLSILPVEGCSFVPQIETMQEIYNKNVTDENHKCDYSDEAERVTIKMVAFDGNSDLVGMANRYNEIHDHVQIEIDFEERFTEFENQGENGIDRIKREIAIGKGPDIIDFGPLYTPTDILGDYLIDMEAYIDNSELQLVENLVHAFSYEGKINVIPTDVILLSMVIPSENDNLIGGWDIDQLIDFYTLHRNESPDILLEYGQTKSEIFDILTMFTLEEFIDWDNGTCDFENVEFRKILEFCNQFPKDFRWDAYPGMGDCYRSHLAISRCAALKEPFDIYAERNVFGTENICYMGYPVEDKNGIITETDHHMFGISKNSQHADEAWDFIQTFLEEDYQKKVEMCPVNKLVFEERLSDAGSVIYDPESGLPIKKYSYEMNGNQIDIYQMSEKDIQQFRDIVYHVDKSTGMDYEILNDILQDEVQSYFSGYKSTDEVCSIIQSRMSINVSEKK